MEQVIGQLISSLPTLQGKTNQFQDNLELTEAKPKSQQTL
jgi:hypothetical protein